MKKWIALLLTAVMLLALTACGGAAESVQTAPAVTAPVAQTPEEPSEEPGAAPTEDSNVYIAYELGANESYRDVLFDHGFYEVYLDRCVDIAEEYVKSGAYATPLSLEFNQNSFRMKVDYAGYDFLADDVVSYGIIEIIGTKSEGLEDLSGFTPDDFNYRGSSTYERDSGETSEFGTFANGYLLEDLNWYYNLNEAEELCDLTYVMQDYYAYTGNLYNAIYCVPEGHFDIDPPYLLENIDSLSPYPSFHPTVETITYGDFTFELSQFAIQCGDERYVYSYRPGMSLSDWACSELNTDGWIPWYDDEVLSPDRAYSYNTGYLDMQGTFDWFGKGNLIIANEYDGSTNHMNNGSIAGVEFGKITPIDPGALMGNQTGGVTAIDVTGMTAEEIQALLAQQGINGGVISAPEGTDVNDLTDKDLLDMISTEESEIAMKGNISAPVAHMVNARTPLFSPGFRIVSKENGRAAYHSTEMTTDLLLDDIIDIYMNNIDDELIPHIKLYAFPESEEFMATLEGHTILNAHPTPLEQGNPMLTIPENAVCLSFERVPDGQEAPNSPNPLKPGHENLNEGAVYARYVTKNDPNFAKGINLVFAITFDDELVYWIHMGANFYATYSGESLTGGMRY